MLTKPMVRAASTVPHCNSTLTRLAGRVDSSGLELNAPHPIHPPCLLNVYLLLPVVGIIQTKEAREEKRGTGSIRMMNFNLPHQLRLRYPSMANHLVCYFPGGSFESCPLAGRKATTGPCREDGEVRTPVILGRFNKLHRIRPENRCCGAYFFDPVGFWQGSFTVKPTNQHLQLQR